MNKKDELIYDLIFSEECEYIIDISEYINNLYKYDKFIAEIKRVLEKSKVTVVKESVKEDVKTVTWKLKVKK